MTIFPIDKIKAYIPTDVEVDSASDGTIFSSTDNVVWLAGVLL